MVGDGAVLELHARSGRAVLVRRGEQVCPPSEPGEDVALPEQLAPALHEWAGVVDALSREPHRADEGHRGWDDLVSDRGRRLASRVASTSGEPVRYVDPVSGLPELIAPGSGREAVPWVTGLPVSAVTAVVIGVALVALSRGLSAAGTGVVVAGNLIVAAGLAPSVWLGRATPVWRWVAHGAAAGIVLTWAALIVAWAAT